MIEPPPAPPVPPQRERWRFPLRLDAVVVVLLLLSALLGFWDSSEGGLLAEGATAPAFDLERHLGGRVRLADLAGKVVVIDYWATWCPPCVEEMPWLSGLGVSMKDQGVVFIAASHDEPADRLAAVSAFVKTRVPLLGQFVAYSNPMLGRQYGVQALPTLYVIGKDGKVARRARGAVSESKVRSWVEEALAKSP